jgi:hypothetical protein
MRVVTSAGQHPPELLDNSEAEVLAQVYPVRDAPTLDAARPRDRLATLMELLAIAEAIAAVTGGFRPPRGV